MYVFQYPGITAANYNQAGFYHALTRSNSLVNVSILSTAGGPSNMPVQVSFDGVTWIQAVTVATGSQGPAPTLVTLGSGFPFSGIAGVRLNMAGLPSTYTLTCCEFFLPVQPIVK